MVKRINAIEGGLSTFEAVANNIIRGYEPEFRKDVFSDVIGDITIDTVKAFDTGMWETGIERKNIEGKWVIVEQYESREDAQKGHDNWVELMRKTPKVKLEDINL